MILDDEGNFKPDWIVTPKDWRKADVIPVFMRVKNEDAGNYRP